MTGDILDRDSVDAALEACDACVHAAAFTSLTPEEMPKALDVNAPGSRIVLDAAFAHGCDPIVAVSSMSVIFPPTGDRLSAHDPVHTGGSPYLASKADAELHTRALQEQGAPIVSLYPAGVTGPLDLGVNVTEGIFAQTLATEYLLVAESGGNLYVDVRDLATAIMAMLVPGLGPAPLHGRRRLPHLERVRRRGRCGDRPRAHAGAVHPRRAGAADRARRGRDHARHRAARTTTRSTVTPASSGDRSPTRCRDTVCWMLQNGRLDPRWAPALA